MFMLDASENNFKENKMSYIEMVDEHRKLTKYLSKIPFTQSESMKPIIKRIHDLEKAILNIEKSRGILYSNSQIGNYQQALEQLDLEQPTNYWFAKLKKFIADIWNGNKV